MFSNNHSSINKSSLNSLNTPLKASVLLVTAIMLSACGSDSDNSYDLKDIFDGSPTVTPGDGDGATGGDTGATGGDTGATGGDTGATGGDTGATGGDTGATGGDTGATGGDTGATGDTGGDTGATGGDTGPTYQSGSETSKKGAQALNIDASAALPGTVFKITTRDFDINSNSLVARADLASEGLLPKVTVTTSGGSDSSTSNGFKRHDDSVVIPTSLGELPLTYSSVYKDFGTQMRIGHIDGAAEVAKFGNVKLPVNGVAVYGNKTLTLPTEGTVAYSGDATYRLIGLDNNIQYGSAEFKADFAAKKVDGNLKFSQAGNIGISGDIVGNEFSGKKGVYSTEGAFYGDDAKYLGGIYSNDSAQGTYGAEKK